MTKKTYKAALFYGPGDLRIEDVPFEPLNPGELRVQIGAATTCGTDKKTYLRGHPVLIKTYPARVGHEMAGTVSEIGKDISRFQVGDRVVIPNSAPCGTCFFCEKNQQNLCENLIFLNGAYAESLVVPAQIVRNNLYKIPDSLSFEQAALTEPLACVLHACDHIGVQARETVVILGTGPMAYLFMQALKIHDAKPIVVGRNPERLQFFSRHAPVIDNTKSGWEKQVRKFTTPYGADVAIESVGQPELWEKPLQLVRQGGRVCLYGGCQKGIPFSLDTYRLHYEEITVSGAFHHTPQSIKKALRLLTENLIDTKPFLEEKRTLHDLPQILSGNDSKNAMKYVVQP